MKKIEQLQFITNGDIPIQHLQQIEAACQAGISWVQLRLKKVEEKTYTEAAKLAKEICREYNTTLVINDNVLVARACKADGIHLGKQDMPPSEAIEILGKDVIIGGTANTWEDVQHLAKQKVDYIGLGPFRFTKTKKNLSPILGLEGYQIILQKMKENQIKIPIIAIGGIELDDIEPLVKGGVYGIAFSGLLCNSENKLERVNQINSKMEK